MFTGIVQELGVVEKISRSGNITKLDISSSIVRKGIEIGDSVAVNGVCLTVTSIRDNSITFELMPETLRTTNLGSLRIKEKANLENSLRLGDKVSGHFVSGHVDCIGIIRKKIIQSGNLVFEIAVPQQFNEYSLPKGSISVDGISLTIQGKARGVFSVYIIPHTLNNTTLSFKGPSDKVNIEFDILAKRSTP